MKNNKTLLITTFLAILVILVVVSIIIIYAETSKRPYIDELNCKYGTFVIYPDENDHSTYDVVEGYRFAYVTEQGIQYKVFPKGILIDEEKHLKLYKPSQVIYCTEN